MFAYVGETRDPAMLREIAAAGFGTCVVRGRVNATPRRARRIEGRWFFDNGAYTDWKHGRPFDQTTWLSEVWNLAEIESHHPDFIVLPDVVAGGPGSLDLSLRWLRQLEGLPHRWALVAQDGMTPEAFPWDAPFDVLFVGGSTDWKLATAKVWADASRAHGKRCHVGRVGSATRVRWAKSARVDSVDSAAPLWSFAAMRRFVDALSEETQTSLF